MLLQLQADVDECSEGTHRCNNVSNCVDMEGSYDCTNENETTTSATPDHTATGILIAYMLGNVNS